MLSDQFLYFLCLECVKVCCPTLKLTKAEKLSVTQLERSGETASLSTLFGVWSLAVDME